VCLRIKSWKALWSSSNHRHRNYESINKILTPENRFHEAMNVFNYRHFVLFKIFNLCHNFNSLCISLNSLHELSIHTRTVILCSRKFSLENPYCAWENFMLHPFSAREFLMAQFFTLFSLFTLIIIEFLLQNFLQIKFSSWKLIIIKQESKVKLEEKLFQEENSERFRSTNRLAWRFFHFSRTR